MGYNPYRPQPAFHPTQRQLQDMRYCKFRGWIPKEGPALYPRTYKLTDFYFVLRAPKKSAKVGPRVAFFSIPSANRREVLRQLKTGKLHHAGHPDAGLAAYPYFGFLKDQTLWRSSGPSIRPAIHRDTALPRYVRPRRLRIFNESLAR